MSVEKLKQKIKEKDVNGCYLFYGEEEFLINHYINELEKVAIDPMMKQMNYIIIEGKTNSGYLIDNLDTLPAFSDNKMVIVKNSNLFKSAPKNSIDKIVEYLPNMPDYNVLIFIQKEIDKRKSLYKAIKKYGLIVELNYQKPKSLTKWAIKVAGAKGKTFKNDAADYLIEICNPDMTGLVNEIEKLCVYVGDKNTIEKQDVQNIVTKSIKSKIFDLTDAISENKTAKALSLLDDMINMKEPIQMIIYMINRQLIILLKAKELINNHVSDGQFSKILGIMPFLVYKTKKQASCFTRDKLREVINLGMEMDMAVKMGQIKDRNALEIIISTLGQD